MADDHHPKKTVKTEPEVVGSFASFDDPHAVLEAARRVKEAGYTKWDVYSPFPLHGIDDIMQRPTILPWICAGGAALGLTTALLLQWWTNGFDYPITVSGKKPFAFPASMPINFELTVLFTAFATFFSVLLLSGLPKLSNPLLRNKRFREKVTDNGIMIVIDADDPKYSRGKTPEFLRSLHPLTVEEFSVVPESTAIPGILQLAAVIVLILASIPPILIVRRRNMLVDTPRIHPVLDMDFQPKFKTQKRNPFFTDDREIRPVIKGTISRGGLEIDPLYYEGLDPSSPMASLKNAAFQEPAPGAPANPPAAPAAPADPAAAAAPAEPVDNTPYTKTFPPEIIDALAKNPMELMERGQQRFNIYCATCHGLNGAGDGLVSLRAAQLEQPTWVKPLSLLDEPIQQQPVGKLFRTATNGIRKMPGYGSQITTRDRWAIVLYIRALQRSRNASASDVPPEELGKLQASN